MRKHLLFAVSACSLLLLSSCSKLGALSSDNFVATPDPMEVHGGQVAVNINTRFPEKYMKRNAVVTIIPELRYGNGQSTQGAGATFQGEKVRDNHQTISYRLGGRHTMKTTFDYVPDMLESDLYVTFIAKQGKKSVQIPAVKIDHGILATPELYLKTLASSGACIAPDSFQRITAQKQEANVRFLVNQAILRQSELKNNSVQEFVRLLKDINADQGKNLNIKNVEVAAYASPEGGYDFNNKLANRRQDVSEEYVKGQLKQAKVDTYVDAHYTAQDWEGFQQLVSASNIQDKDVILRVLSMYKDPEEREQQIRNMSEGFRELADGILPELRRARLTINYDVVGRSDDEIKAQYAADPSKLTLEELLYAATLTDNATEKENIYRTATRLHDKDYRAYNNLAALAFDRGQETTAKTYLQDAKRVNLNAPEAYANEALILLKNGKKADAELALAKAVNANGYQQVAGTLNLAKGNYVQAAKELAGTNTNSEGLALLLNKDYEGAIKALDKVKNPDAVTAYLHAIVAARKGNKFAASSYLEEALQKDPSLKEYADKDLELSFLR